MMESLPTPDNSQSLVEIARSYLALGLCVVPCYAPLPDGGCSCGNPTCDKPAKHPALSSWREYQKRLPTQAEVESWFARPGVNVGCLTGAVSGIIVLDIDPRHGGDESLRDLLTGRTLPQTVTVLTGGGGQHLYFKHPGRTIRNAQPVDKAHPGIDAKGDGGFIVLPPSLHISGRHYEWEISSSLNETAFAEMPAWLIEFLTGAQPAKAGNLGRRFNIEDSLLGVPDGERGDWAARVAGHFIGQGQTLEQVMMALLFYNRRNRPPMDDARVEATVQSIWDAEERKKALLNGSQKIDPDSLDSMERLEIAQALWERIGVPGITRWVLLQGEKTEYRLGAQGHEISLGESILEQRAVRNAVANGLKVVILKRKDFEWDRLAQQALNVVEELVYEGPPAVRVQEWLTEFVSQNPPRTPAEEDIWKVLPDAPIVYQEQVIFRLERLAFFLEASFGLKTTTRWLARELRAAGLAPRTINIMGREGRYTTRSIWSGPASEGIA